VAKEELHVPPVATGHWDNCGVKTLGIQPLHSFEEGTLAHQSFGAFEALNL